MALTLNDVKVGKADKVDQQIIDTFMRNSELLSKMEFDNTVTPSQGSTLTYGYLQTTTPSVAGRRNINGEYTPAEAKKTKLTADLDIMGGAYQIDRVLDEAQPEEVAYQAEEKIKSTINYFHNQFINGSKVAGDKFDGLDKLLTGKDTEFESTSNLSVTTDSALKTQAIKVCEELDAVIASMAETPDYIIANTKAIIKLKSAARVLGYLTSAENAFGRKVEGYNGIPFMDLKDYVSVDAEGATTQTPIIPVVASTGKTDIYFVKLGKNAVMGATINGDKIIKSHLPDFTEAKAVHTGDVEFVAAVVLKNSRMAGVLRGVQVSATNG